MALTENGGVQATMPVAPAYSGGGFGGFGGDGNGLWVLLFFIILLGGWGNGWGNGNNGGGGTAQPGYVLTSDFSNLERKMDIIQGDNCTNFASVQAALSNGFGQQMTAMHDGFSNAELARSGQMQTLMSQMYNQNMTAMQNACDASRQTAEGFNTTNYNMAAQSAAMQNSMNVNTRDIIDAQNNGTQAILNALTAQRMEAKDDKIADLTSQLSAARLAASQQAQNNYLVNELRPSPIPAYQVQNPWANNGCGCYTCGMSA